MNDDVAGLVERLEAFRPTYGWPEEQAVVAGPTLGEEAASTIRALVAENDRLTEERDEEAVQAHVQYQLVIQAEAKLREAVNVMRSIENYSNDTLVGSSENAGSIGWYRAGLRVVRERAHAFLATMEKQDE